MTGHNPFQREDRPQPPAEVATERQRSYVTDLLMTRAGIKGMDLTDAREATEVFVVALTKTGASAIIDRVKEENHRLRLFFGPLQEDAKRMAVKPAVGNVLEDGMYVRGDGKVFKLYHTVHGANELVAKELVIEGDTGEFIYRGKGPLASLLTNSRRLTLEEARAFGAIYGQCCRCLAPLTHEISIALGIGPKCGGHEYGDEFKVLYQAAKASLAA